MKPGKYTIKELFVNRDVEQIVIPEIQRDYVWGHQQVEGLLKSIYDDFNMFLTKDINVTADNKDIEKLFKTFYKKSQYSSNVGFIYAYNDSECPGKYFLIDGQQRLTTVYLLILALSKVSIDKIDEFKKLYFYEEQLKIDFKVRDSSHDFFREFIKFCLKERINITDKISTDFRKKISTQFWYYKEYDNDKTIQSIINNFIVINSFINDNKLKTDDFNNYVQNYLDCWYFDTGISEQGEELYIYMNARGEQIQNNENIKAELLGNLTTDEIKLVKNRDDFKYSGLEPTLVDLKNYWGKKWENWQDFFWKYRDENENADIGFNEFLRWIQILKILKSWQGKIVEENDNTIDKKEINAVIKWEKSNGDENSVRLKTEYFNLYEIELYFQSVEYLFEQFDLSKVQLCYNDYPIKNLFKKKWLSASSSEKNSRILSQKELFRLLPILKLKKLCLEKNTPISDHDFYRISRFIYNVSKVENVGKAVNSLIISFDKTIDEFYEKGFQDIIKILEISSVSISILSNEERFKLEQFKNSDNENRIQLESLFWSIEDHELNRGEIGHLIQLACFSGTEIKDFALNEKFNYTQIQFPLIEFNKINLQFLEIFPLDGSISDRLWGHLILTSIYSTPNGDENRIIRKAGVANHAVVRNDEVLQMVWLIKEQLLKDFLESKEKFFFKKYTPEMLYDIEDKKIQLFTYFVILYQENEWKWEKGNNFGISYESDSNWRPLFKLGMSFQHYHASWQYNDNRFVNFLPFNNENKMFLKEIIEWGNN